MNASSGLHAGLHRGPRSRPISRQASSAWPCCLTDKHETKLKGVIYFQAIEEVYYDHLRSAAKVRRAGGGRGARASSLPPSQAGPSLFPP